MRFLRLATMALLLVSLCQLSCTDENHLPDEEQTPLISAGDEARHMLLMYIVADNDLSSYAQMDLREVLSVADKVPNDCYLLAFVDDNNSPRVLRYFNNNGAPDYETVHNFGREFSACDVADMRVLFDWLEQNYPTKSMDLVLWSHATGWLRDDGPHAIRQYSFGYDMMPGDNSDYGRMYIEELADFLKKTTIKPGKIMFDACFMQCAEVAYAMRDCADWIIASPAEIPANGAPYEVLVPLFFDATATPQNIIDAYKAAYDGTDTGVVLSAVKCNAMQQFADATAIAVKKALAGVSGSNCSDVFSYLPGGYFGRSNSFPNFFDMNAVMRKYLSVADYASWQAALDEVLPYRCASISWYTAVNNKTIYVDDTWSGISMYLPNTDTRFNKFNTTFTALEWYNAAAWNEIE